MQKWEARRSKGGNSDCDGGEAAKRCSAQQYEAEARLNRERRKPSAERREDLASRTGF
jgi:hypothetical protein